MVIKILDLDKCIKKFKNLEGVDLMPEIRKGTYKVQKTAVALAPVGTPESTGVKGYVGGTLKSSIRVSISKKEQYGMVYTNLEYAIYQEFGTRFQKGTPFLLPAMKIEKQGIIRNMRDYLKKQTREKVR